MRAGPRDFIGQVGVVRRDPQPYGHAGDASPEQRHLVALRQVAAERRDARRWLLDLTPKEGRCWDARAPAQAAYTGATVAWSELIRQGMAAGHTLSDVARAAGCAGRRCSATSRIGVGGPVDNR